MVDASGGVTASTILSVAIGIVTIAGAAIAVLWKLDRTQLTDHIKKLEEENAKLNNRLDYSAKKIGAMAAEYVATRTDLAREQSARETREGLGLDRGSSPGRAPTNPNMQAVPLPLPPPRVRHE